MPDPVTLTVPECRELVDLIDGMTGNNIEHLFAPGNAIEDYDDPTLTTALVKLLRAAGRGKLVPKELRRHQCST